MHVMQQGFHVGASDLPVAVARKLLGPEKIVGATAKTVEAAKKRGKKGQITSEWVQFTRQRQR